MLRLSAGALTLAALLGAALAILHLRPGAKLPPSLLLRLAHGLLAASGFALLVAAVAFGPRRGTANGVGAFGWDALALLGATLLLGLAVPVLGGARKRLIGPVATTHGILAIIGYVILLAYLSLG